MVAAIAASGSVTRAAGELHRTQSAVSHQLRGIEERLGTPLFLRVGEAHGRDRRGRTRARAAHRVLEDIRATEEDVRRLGAREAGCRARLRAVQYRVSLAAAAGGGLPSSASGRSRSRSPSNARSGHWRRCSRESWTSPSSPNPSATIRFGSDRSSRTSMRRSSRRIIRLRSARSCARRTSPSERLLLYSSSPDDSFTIQTILRPAGVVPQRVTFVMLTEAILEMVKARPRDQRDADLGDRARAAGRRRSRHPDHRRGHPQAVECGHPQGRRDRGSCGRVHRAFGQPLDAGSPASALASWAAATQMMGTMRATTEYPSSRCRP